MIKHVIADSDNMMLNNCMPCQHPQHSVPEWPEHFHDKLDDSAFIFCYVKWPVISVFWTLKPLLGECL
jgi:hypothetical protein